MNAQKLPIETALISNERGCRSFRCSIHWDGDISSTATPARCVSGGLMLNLTREQGALLLLIVFLALCIVLLFLGRTTPEERRAAGIGNPEDDNEPLRPVNARRDSILIVKSTSCARRAMTAKRRAMASEAIVRATLKSSLHQIGKVNDGRYASRLERPARPRFQNRNAA
jgi:hypothetical protein